MPKRDRDPLGLQGGGIDDLGKIADPESYRGMKNFVDSVFSKRKPTAPKPSAMNRKQVAKSASDLGYTMTKDGRFVKNQPQSSKKKVKAKVGLGGHRGA